MTVDNELRTTPTPRRTLRRHEHGWQTESAHRTSLGLLRYVICPGCGGRRVDLQPHPESPPVALTAELSPPCSGPSDKSVGGEHPVPPGGRMFPGKA